MKADALVADLVVVIGAALFLTWAALFAGGCAATVHAAASRPCLPDGPPREAKLLGLEDPERFAYMTDGEARVGLRFAVDFDSLRAFMEYVRKLEAVAVRAAGCRR